MLDRFKRPEIQKFKRFEWVIQALTDWFLVVLIPLETYLPLIPLSDFDARPVQNSRNSKKINR